MLNLTPKELKEVTGKSRRYEQIKALVAMKIPYLVRPDGVVIVCRDAYLSAAGCDIKPEPQQSMPDFGAMNVS